MSETPTQREPPLYLDRILAAHECRARLIAQMHRQAMETANNLLNQHTAIEAGFAKVAKDAKRRRTEAIAGALVVALGCILALLAMMQ